MILKHLSSKFGLALAALAATGVFAFYGADRSAAQQTIQPYTAEVTAAPTSMAQVSLSFAPVVKQAAPAVVNIYTRKRITRNFNDPMFEMLFGRRLGPRSRDETSLGSGVIVREDGVVLTNAHVIAGADEITVALTDRREFEARVLLSDERSDLAVLQIEAAGLPALSFADSDAAEVGDLVLAIGNPFGIGQTVTSGIVSAQTRTAEDGNVFIQTDAAINPGNSGGALVDMNGALVGVNTMILSRSGGSNGVGFAIPANLARRAVESAAAGGAQLTRAWIGVAAQPVTHEIAESLGMAFPEGVILSALHPMSPLATSGLSQGDVILSIDDQPVADMAALDYRLGARATGETATVAYLRGGERETTLVSIIAAPEDPPRDLSQIKGYNPLDGLLIANLNPALAQERGFAPDGDGVVVMGLERGAAARYGFRPGDVIRAINDTRIARVSDLRRLLETEQPRGWRIEIERDGRRLRLVAQG